ncbi:PDZ domain-containing protein [Deinococcus lacus]|uniref:PDZ domain-containing protein n=1 Tax=Deinococcus lacus TaxID=392561 RepID=A0ABW1YC27_9DEIO
MARGSPAEAAGLRGAEYNEAGDLIHFGDIITGINGVATPSANDVIAQVRRAKIGDVLTVRYWRGEQEYTAKVKLVARRSVPDLHE